MKSKVLAIGAVVALLIVAAVLWAASQPDDTLDPDDSTSNTQTTNNTTDNSSTLPTFTTQDVAKHNTKTDCWTIIDGQIYDLTSFIPVHKGGDNILSACGHDATTYFRGQQAGQEGGINNHLNDPDALSQLELLKIGTLAN